MRAPIVAILGRSLRFDSRAPTTYLMRLGLLGVIFLSLIGAHLSSARIGAPGLHFLSPIIWINLIFISIAAVTYFSSVITEEKEEMTLGLLRLTGLTPVAILLGKSTSRLIGALMLIAAQVPFTLLAVTLGGVSLHQVLASYATIAAYTVLLANLALLSSIVSRNTVRASAFTLILMLAFLLGGPIGSWIVAELRMGYPAISIFAMLAPPLEWLLQANPFVQVGKIMVTGFSGSPVSFQVVADLVLGGALFGLSWALFGLANREQQSASQTRGFVLRRTSRFKWLTVSAPWNEAIAWKEFYFLTGGRFMMFARCAFLAAVPIVVVIVAHSFGERMPLEAVGGLLLIVPLFVAPLELISHASRMFREEMNWHTLSDLTLVPMSPHRLIKQKFLGILPVLIPYGVSLFFGMLFAAEGFFEAAVALLKTGMAWYLPVNYILLLYLVVLCSLFVKRSSVLVAGFIWVVCNIRFEMSLVGMIGKMPGWSLVVRTATSGVLIALIVLIHYAIVARLERAAGD